MWLTFLANHWKKLVVLVAMLACLAGGAYLGRKTAEPVVKTEVREKIVEVTKVVKVEVEKNKTETKRHVEIVETPDGTKTTTIDEHIVSDTETTKHETKESEKTTDTKTKEVAPAKPTTTKTTKFRVGGFVERKATDLVKTPLDKPNYGAAFAYRLAGPIWADSTYNFGSKSMTLGVSVEF